MTTDRIPPLTSRETEVARLVADGLTDYECALVLMTSIHTVRSHIGHIIDKLNVEKRPYCRRRVIARWMREREQTPVAIAPAA